MEFQKDPFITDYVRMWIEDGIVHTSYPAGLVISLSIAKKIVADRLEYTEGKTYPGLADVRSGKKADYDAMKYWATPDAYHCLSALAIYSDNRLAKIFVNFWLKVDKPYKPTKYFNDLSQAYLFLQPYVHTN